MTDYDPIPDIERLGYTPREAGFLALAALHSGYFLRRHFSHYIHKQSGGLAHDFVSKAQKKGHVRVLPLPQRRFIFHVSSRTLYRLCGVEESQNRHTKGDRAIKTRLLSLDYVLDHPQQHFFRTEQQKLAYFRETLGIPSEKLPSVTLQSPSGNQRCCYFPHRFPISILGATTTHPPQVSFCFVDDGIQTLHPFRRFVLSHEQLIRLVPSSEIVYVAESERNFSDAGRILSSILPRLAPDTLATRECPRGVHHFLAYLEARQVFEEGYVSPTFEQSRILAEGGSIYATSTHDEIFEAWIEGNLTLEQIRARYAEKPGKISIRGYLIRADFPYNGPKYRGVE
jgi:hypothetical protein